MAKISGQEINAYRKNLDTVANKAAIFSEQYVAALLAENPKASFEEIKELIKQAFEETLVIFGTQSAVLACDFFDAIMKKYNSDTHAKIEDGIDKERIEKKASYLSSQYEQKGLSALKKDLSKVSSYYIKRQAYENMVRNCKRNDAAYARVPSGMETCSWCFMLASRGFVYAKEESAKSGMHTNCDCLVVPGFKHLDHDSQINGYKPSEMKARFDDFKAEFDNLPKEEKRKYNNGTQGYIQSLLDKQLVSARWLYTGNQK